MTYTALHFALSSPEDYLKDLLIQSLADIGFESFEENDKGFSAYIPSGNFSEEKLKEALQEYRPAISFTYTVEPIEQQNWNVEWEKNFSPVQIGKECYIRATFHKPQPSFPYEIVIAPKMAFGTGHHDTTSQMAEYLFEVNLANKTVLDMGCGTGILAILAHKLGAQPVTAIDIDEIAIENTLENAALNNISDIATFCGGAEMLSGKVFDVILANINRNILLKDLQSYRNSLAPSGVLLLSGFYTEDLPLITEAATKLSLEFINQKVKNNWVAARFSR